MDTYDQVSNLFLKQDEYTLIDTNQDKESNRTCSVCFIGGICLLRKVDNNENANPLQLSDIDPGFFSCGYIPDEIIFLGPCKKHALCVRCLRNIVHSYTNHPINDSTSHFTCPYPFEECVTPIGFKNIYEHALIKKVCRTDQEWEHYSSYAEQYAFPGYTIIKCHMPCTQLGTYYNKTICNSDILINNTELKQTPRGEMIVECTQNRLCRKRFCYYCKEYISYHSETCHDCKVCYENENPNLFNYFLNKNTNSQLTDCAVITTLQFEESEYLYTNKEITKEIAFEQIDMIIRDANNFLICPVCKISLYKTEKCNGLSHHCIERCYACGRIGYRIKGLAEHWNPNGIAGCFRFDTDYFVKNYIPSFMCTEEECSNHDIGDCNISEHQTGIHKLQKTRTIGYIYHTLLSLMKTIRFEVYDMLFEKYKNDESIIELLPYKQTLCNLEIYKKHLTDYTETIFYSNINCMPPWSFPNVFTDKSVTIDPDDYIIKYSNIKYYWNQYENLQYNSSSINSTNSTTQILPQRTNTPVQNLSNGDSSTGTLNIDIDAIIREVELELEEYSRQQQNVENGEINTDELLLPLLQDTDDGPQDTSDRPQDTDDGPQDTGNVVSPTITHFGRPNLSGYTLLYPPDENDDENSN